MRAHVAALLLVLVACESGRKETVQVGYRGLAQELNYDASKLHVIAAANRAPAPLAPASEPSPPAQFQNVQVLTDVSANEFNRTMLAMTQWVAPQQSCGYCHDLTNFASDAKYTKVVARRMLQMTRSINSQWKPHVQGTGVTCYSCHRGNPVPQQGLWHYTDENQFLRAYLDRSDVRVQSQTIAHTNANNSSIRQTENTYALMMNASRALGVNCTFCHNSRSWTTWQNAPPARITAMYGFRMVRDLNTNYLTPLQSVFPAARLGPHGDAPKLQCVTCHQGVYKPLGGAQMVKDYPALWGAPTWARGGANDTVSAGVRDLRGRDSVPNDAAPRLPAQTAHPSAAPVRASATSGMR
ncbi:MAG: photosynthetic reaction center cytochrome c subunit [Gemmatirosa sp.]|nr:photosynthetic reaction center cytochrome c subunit [Gemmatirosa sp.]